MDCKQGSILSLLKFPPLIAPKIKDLYLLFLSTIFIESAAPIFHYLLLPYLSFIHISKGASFFLIAGKMVLTFLSISSFPYVIGNY